MLRIFNLILVAGFLWTTCGVADEEKRSSEVKQMMQFADGLFDRGFYDLAVPEYRKLLSVAPDSALAPQASYQLARAYLKSGDNKGCLEALKEFSESLDKGGFRIEVTLLQAELEEAAGHADVALNLYSKIVSGRTSMKVREMALFRKARLLSASAKLKEATVIYKSLAAKGIDSNYPYRAYSLYYLGYVSQLEGKLDEAVSYYLKLIGGVDTKWAQLPDAYFNLGRLYFAQQKYSNALNLFSMLLYRFPTYKNSRDVIMKMILVYYEQGKFDKALNLIAQKRKALSPVMDHVSYIEGNCFFVLKNYEAALKAYQRVIATKGSVYVEQTQTQVVVAYIQQQNFKKAFEFAAGVAQKIKPPHWQGREIFAFYTGYAAYKTGHTDDAIVYLELTLKILSPKFEEYQKSEMILAELYQENGRLKEGLKLYRKVAMKLEDPLLIRLAFDCALKMDDEKVLADLFADLTPLSWGLTEDIVVTYARWLVRKNKYDEAVTVLNSFLVEKKSRAVSFMAGYVLFYQQKYKAAVSKLKVIAGDFTDETSKSANLYLGWSKIRLGQEKSGGLVVSKVLQHAEENWPELEPWEWRDLASEMMACRFHNEALKIYQFLLKTATGGDRLKVVTGQLTVYQKLGAHEKAVKTIRRLIASGGLSASDKLTAKSLLAETMLWAGRQGVATILFKEVLASKPSGVTSARASWGLATTYLQQQRYGEALRMATTCYILHPDKRYSPKAMVVALRCFDATKEPDKAKKVWDELDLKFPVEAQLMMSKDVLSKSLKEKLLKSK